MESLIAEVRLTFHHDCVNIEDMEKLLLSYKSDPAHWSQYALFDERTYTRNLVDTGNGKYNMIVLCWGPGMCTNIHDHSGAHCFVKILEGTLKETRFAFPEENSTGKPLVKTGESYVSANDVSYMSGYPTVAYKFAYTFRIDEHWKLMFAVLGIEDRLGLHRMENPSHSENAVSLHIYSPPYEECYLFDQRTSQRHASKVTFWSRYGKLSETADVPFDKIQTSSRQG